MKLIVVESPTKAKTLKKFLGSGFKIEASMGHLRDLPKSKLGVEVADGFRPEYVISPGKKKQVALLRKAAQGIKEIILATDLDREGEAIAYHVKFLLTTKSKERKFSRIVFHEITKRAIEEALKQPRQVDLKLVEAQEARRILDRLVGYKLSPVLWRKVRRGLSAGRVQSVAVRLIAEREKEIQAFKPQEYWQIKVELTEEKDNFLASLEKIGGKKAVLTDKKEAQVAVTDLRKGQYQVETVVKTETKRRPLPPFMTSTLQRTAGSRLGWSAKKTMREAQLLYEKGLITYHRTDSLNLAQEAIAKVRRFIVDRWGKEYLPDKANYYKSKAKNTQGAHEAIRPTKPEQEKANLGQSSDRLYRLIWERFVACQMKPALIKRVKVWVGTDNLEKKYELEVQSEKLEFLGWLKVNPKLIQIKDEFKLELKKGQKLTLVKVIDEQKFTQPLPRYTEASLIKVLEEKGIGRPSTYAPIISTILLRNYVEKKDKKLWPTTIGMTVTEFLMKYFSRIMDYEFTAGMEKSLDEVAEGKNKRAELLGKFYFPFEKKIEKVIETAKRVKIPVETTGQKCPDCKKGKIVIRTGRFGKFLSCDNFPDCKYTATYKQVVDKVRCPDCNSQVVIKKSRKGRQFYGCANYPKCKWASWQKPKEG